MYYSSNYGGSDDSSNPSEPPSAYSYEYSEKIGLCSYSDLSPEYEDDFDSASGFKMLKIRDHKDDLPVEYHKSGPMRPIFYLDTISDLQKIKLEYFDNIQIAPRNRTIFLSFSSYESNFAEFLAYFNSRISVHQKKHIQHLAVDFSHYEYIGKEFRDIIRFFTNSFPSTKYLYLIFKPALWRKCRRTDEDLVWLGLQITKNMPNLKHFALQFYDNDLITSQGLKLFCRQIAKRSKRLECLSLDFSKCKKVTGNCLKSLTKYLSASLRHLKNLNLNIPGVLQAHINDIHFSPNYSKKLEGLGLGINQVLIPNNPRKFPKELRQLSLHLYTNRSLLNNLDQLSSSCLQPAQNLRFLNLHLTNLNVVEQEAQEFVKTLNSKIKALDSLKINLNSCSHLIPAFLKSLECPEQNQLKKLEFGFDSPSENSDITLVPVELFSPFTSHFLQRLKNLTYLDLKLQTLHIQDPQVKNLAACIAKDLHELEFLNIFFFLCPAITNESVKAFQEDFCAENTLPNLQTLILSFSNCHQINKKPIKSLRSALKKRIPAIQSATVNFIEYLADPHYCSSDDEDNEIARDMADCQGPEWKAIKIHPKAYPSRDNWRFVKREDFEADSSYDESDGVEENAEDEALERGWWRRIKEESGDDQENEDNQDDEFNVFHGDYEESEKSEENEDIEYNQDNEQNEDGNEDNGDNEDNEDDDY